MSCENVLNYFASIFLGGKMLHIAQINNPYTWHWRCQWGSWNPFGKLASWQGSYTWWLPKKPLKEIFPGNFCFYTMKSSQFPSFCLLIAVLEFTFCQFLDKNCLEIFSNVVFLLVTMCGYPAMMPISQTDFMLLTDISNVMCLVSKLIQNVQSWSYDNSGTSGQCEFS